MRLLSGHILPRNASMRSGTRDIISHLTIRFDISLCRFLLVAHWNQASIFSRFWDISM